MVKKIAALSVWVLLPAPVLGHSQFPVSDSSSRGSLVLFGPPSAPAHWHVILSHGHIHIHTHTWHLPPPGLVGISETILPHASPMGRTTQDNNAVPAHAFAATVWSAGFG